ncbi:PspC domain-containing protein [Sporanaerobacter acetigenes]|uniref:Phage shock protein C (PspC) family protein n=1 Tax=Sporanaerobacter acetigenes DSM 13106 TaxID=1123281 RepID=A0A1M5YJE2_9FIRM|nr:PspC domain-containing protein [Sporanaerobacter acetigenes]SHI12141.1 phage shock protein C (PspC) family protein [Sporanaerobacter acetigenes DSM 13106]
MARKIYRSSTDKVISGVCGGLGEYFNVDPSIIRIFWLMLSIATSGTGILAYIICALVIPEGSNTTIYYDENDKSYKNSALFVGIVLIIIGASLLIKKIWPWFNVKWFNFSKYWPILLIIAGIYVIYNQKKKK